MFQKEFIETPDIKEKLYSDFGDAAKTALKILREAIIQHDHINSTRTIRCIIYLADKNLDALKKYIANAIGDPRDVMYWAEYIGREQGSEGELKRLRDFNNTFQDCENNLHE